MWKVTLAFGFLALAACAEAPQRDEPVVIHAEQPKSLVGEWASDAIWAAWDAACPEEKPGRLGWTTRAITPPPNDAGMVFPDRMTGTVECDDGSHHEIVILFDAPAPVQLEALPPQGFVIGRAAGVEFVDLDGTVLDRVPGFSLYYEWTVPGPVILRSGGVYYRLDVEAHALRPFESRDDAASYAPQFQEGVDPSRERYQLVDEPDTMGAPDASGFWAFALPSPDGTRLLAEWSGECESQIAFLANGDGSDPRPVTGQQGLVGAPGSEVLGWTAEGEALVFMGSGGPCGPETQPAGVYRFDRPGEGVLMIPVPEPTGVRMWGPA